MIESKRAPEWPCPALRNADLSAYTTAKLGGRVQWLLEPTHPEQFVEAYRAAREAGFAPRILGGGANLLIADGELAGCVITTARMSRLFRPRDADVEPEMENEDELLPLLPHLVGRPDPNLEPERKEDPRLVAWAGAGLPGLVRTTKLLGWSGFEGMVGVPGHVGGGIAMNAGGRWGEMWDVIESVRVLTPEGEVEHLQRDACNPSYRNGNLQGAIVLGAVMRFEVSTKAQVEMSVRAHLAEKSATQPLTERSSGCIFKNPDPELSDGKSAGLLIEECGGKGWCEGQAMVSPKHANFIINQGGARTSDVLRLIERLQELVAAKTGVVLETEVRLWT